MTILEFLVTWDWTMSFEEWRAVFLIAWLLFLVALFT